VSSPQLHGQEPLESKRTDGPNWLLQIEIFLLVTEMQAEWGGPTNQGFHYWVNEPQKQFSPFECIIPLLRGCHGQFVSPKGRIQHV
jgi:hypothetical protein